MGGKSDLTPRAPGVLYVADEPEAHLHPTAIRSIASWLARLGLESGSVLVATHSPVFLEVLRDSGTLVFVERVPEGSQLSVIDGAGVRDLERVAAALGANQAELLQLVRLVLFVEGPHDRAVLEGMIGEDLDAGGIRILPLHGTRNALALVDSEVVAMLGIRIGVLFDDTRPRNEIPTSQAASNEERTMARLERELAIAGRSAIRFGVRKRDIIEYLPARVMREVAPDFPGWAEAAREAKVSRVAVKEHVTSSYGVPLSRSAIRRMAERTRELGVVPKEILQLAKSVVAEATRL